MNQTIRLEVQKIMSVLFLFSPLCAGLHSVPGYIFQDNQSTERYIAENGELTFELPSWSSKIG